MATMSWLLKVHWVIHGCPLSGWTSLGLVRTSQSTSFPDIVALSWLGWIFRLSLVEKVVFSGLVPKLRIVVSGCSHVDRCGHVVWTKIQQIKLRIHITYFWPNSLWRDLRWPTSSTRPNLETNCSWLSNSRSRVSSILCFWAYFLSCYGECYRITSWGGCFEALFGCAESLETLMGPPG